MKWDLIAAVVILTIFPFQGATPRPAEDEGTKQITDKANANQDSRGAPPSPVAATTTDSNQGQSGAIASDKERRSVRITPSPLPIQSVKDGFDIALVFLTALIVVVGVFQILFLCRTVKATKATADALTNSERAWVMVELQRPTDRHEGLTSILSNGIHKVGIDLYLICKNDGRTPAWLAEKHVWLAMVKSISPEPQFAPIDGDFVENGPEPLGVGGQSKVRIEAICEERKELGCTVIVYGFVKYRDVFSPDRETRFGYEVGSDNRLQRISGLERYNSAT